MTMIEIMITIGIIAVVTALLFPAVAGMKKRADAARCIGNLRQVGAAMLQMAADQQGVLRHWYFGSLQTGVSEHWVGQLKNGKFLTMEEMQRLRCSAIPANTEPNKHNWGFNLSDPFGIVAKPPGGASNSKVYQITVTAHPSPSRSLLLASVSNGMSPADAGAPTDLRIFPTGSTSLGRVHLPHDGKGEMFFLDGHAEIATPSRLSEIAETLGGSGQAEYYDENHKLQISPAL